ncbi:MAG TPA: type II and III secretion system protein family protein [Pyrinomonadaceae bacterium]|nr:type II and III secretion system protein family protein [Pyrinomonadaceae bacterium]
MQKTRRLIPLIAAVVCAAMLGLVSASAARAQGASSISASFAEPPKEAVPVNVLVGQSRVINFDRKIGRFSVSNPEVAEAVMVAPDQVLVNGKAFGQVNFIAWEKETGRFVVFDVFVRANLSLIDSQIRALFPKDDIRLSQANGSVVLSGSVANPQTASQAEQVVKAAGFQTVNMLASPTADKAQVQLMVRVAEVSRNKARELAPSYGMANRAGVGYLNSGNSPTSVRETSIAGTASSYVLNLASPLNVLFGNGDAGLTGFLRALNSVGAIRSLAEPNLIAMDGQQASFLAGGEFPVPVVAPNGDRLSVAIVWKEYGVRLNFKPTIIDEDHIRLELEPEVSTIDFSNGVKFDGFVVPALKTRRAKTGVELRDGQSFALAGLLDNNEIKSFSKVPGLGDIPVLGHLFRSKSFQANETELMFIVTAQMVRPMNRDELPQFRGIDGLKTGSPLGVEPKGEGINGVSGFSIGTGAPAAEAAKPAAEKAQSAPAAPSAPAAAAPAQQPAPAKETKAGDVKAEAPKAQAQGQPAALPAAGANLSLSEMLNLARTAPPHQW